MKEALLTTLRDKNTSLDAFRAASRKLSSMLAAEVAAKIKQKVVSIETTLAKANGFKVAQDVVLVPILRAGIALLPSFMYFFDHARVGFLGMRRDEKTALPKMYYENLPTFHKEEWVLLLDPMIATGGSSKEAIKKVIEKGAKEENIYLIGIVAAPEGIQEIENEFPKVKVHVVSIDEKLNDEKFIVPGLGDFGDRFFASK